MINDVGTTKSCSFMSMFLLLHTMYKSMVQPEYQISTCHMIYFVRYGCFYTNRKPCGAQNK